MAITTADGWFAAATQKLSILKMASVTAVSAQHISLWDITGNPGAGSLTIGNTTNGIVPTDATAGTPLIRAFDGGAVGYLAAGRYRGSVAGGAILYDRLFHAGSFSLAALTTFNLTAQPSFLGRIPGGTDFTNLEFYIEINQAIAASAATVAITYTNELGVSGRSTGASSSLASIATRRLFAMPLQAGDKGVQSINSVIVGGVAAATGTVNIVLARRLAEFDVRVANGLDAQAWDLVGAPVMFADSALWQVGQPDGAATGFSSLALDIKNG